MAEEQTFLQDKQFLQDLAYHPNKIVYAKITALNNQDEAKDLPIVGEVTGGSINVDGAAAVQRSCSLTMVTDQVDKVSEYDWAYSTRFKLEIGLKNEINSNYPDIVYFPQGIFVITSFNWSLNTNGCNINISGQDKMCLLSGEVSGTVTAQTDFGKYEQLNDQGEVVEVKQVPLVDIIKNLVQFYGNETLDNNSITDLEGKRGLNLLEYRGKEPLYLLLQKIDDEYKIVNATIFGDWKDNNGTKISELDSYFQPGNLQNSDSSPGTKFNNYCVRKIEYGDVAGYEATELIFAGELIANVGESATSVLDKIKNMLGEYEYFYDIKGKFKFRKKQSSLKVEWNEQSPESGISLKGFAASNENDSIYTFKDYQLINSISVAPNLKNLKNDFTVWGTKKSVNGSSLPIHMRIAINEKPTFYQSYWQGGRFWWVLEDNVDWREIIYQMAKDYYNWNQKDPDYYQHLCKGNEGEPWLKIIARDENNKIIDARTGYEQYYNDIYTFWRQLYDPSHPVRYERTHYRPNANLYRHPWEEAPEDCPLTDLYIVQDKCYIRWIDSIALTLNDSSECDLHYLYIGNKKLNTYTPVLDTVTIDEYYPYVLKDGEEIYNTLDKNNTWGAGENIEKLYYKKKGKNIFEPIIKYYNLDYLSSNPNGQQGVVYFDKVKIWIGELNEYRYLSDIKLIDKDGSISTSLDAQALITHYSSANKIQYKTTESDSQMNDFKAIDKIFIGIKTYKDDLTDYAVYIDTENGKKPYLTYLKETGYNGKNLDPTFLYFKKVITDGNTYTSIIDSCGDLWNKENLYITTGENKYEHFYEALDRPSNAYMIDRTEYCQDTSAGSSEIYYKCKWDGTMDKSIEYHRYIEYYQQISEYGEDHWHINVKQNPDQLLFWFDFIEPGGSSGNELIKPYSIDKIGLRPLAKNDQQVTSIYNFTAPAAYYGTLDFQLPDRFKQFFTISSLGKSANEEIEHLLYTNTYATEAITINTIPLYWLEPNTKIKVKKQAVQEGGDQYDTYILDKISIPLTYNGMMTLNCTKVPLVYLQDNNNNQEETTL